LLLKLARYLIDLVVIAVSSTQILIALMGVGFLGFLIVGAETFNLPTNLPTIGQQNLLTCGALQEIKVKDTDMTFRVGSTSKINDLRYDPNTKNIVISASGEDGKQGVLCLEVPKDLLGSKILVDVDDPNAKYEVTDRGSVSLVKVQYKQ